MTEVHSKLLEALKSLGGKATVGDLAQKTGLADHEVKQDILAALSHVGGHVAVDAHGRMLYSIETSRRLPRFSPAWYSQLWTAFWLIFKWSFFAALSIALVMYFVVYVVIIVAVLVAAIAAAARGGDCDCDCDCKGDCGKCDCSGCGSCCEADACCSVNKTGDKIYERTVARKQPELMAARRALREKQGEVKSAKRAEKRLRSARRIKRLRDLLANLRTKGSGSLDFPLEKEELSGKPPFFRAVRDFVFGPIRTPPSEDAERNNLIGFIRDHGGRITATDATMLTGLPRASADRLLLDLAVKLGGDVDVSESGAVVYTFDDFVVTAAADAAELEWLDERPDGRVTVTEFAEAQGLPAAEALSRLELLNDMAKGRIEHGAVTTFVFDEGARRRLADRTEGHRALRDYRFIWERLEQSPAIIGVPAEHRGWIWWFNGLNLLMSFILLALYADGTRLVGDVITSMSPDFELWSLGILPFFLSAGVFLIPLARLIIEAIRDLGRKKRNTRRLMLLGLAHCLTSRPQVRATDIIGDLSLSLDAKPEVEHQLTKLGAEFEAGLSLDFRDDSADAIDFDLAYRELMAVMHHADEYRLASSGLKEIVYDTSKPL
jgi:hypothetical protein